MVSSPLLAVVISLLNPISILMYQTGHEGADECNFEFDVEAGDIDIDAV